MLINLQKTITSTDQSICLVFKREIKLPISPIIGMSIKGLQERDSDDSIDHIYYDNIRKNLVCIVQDSVFRQYDNVEQIIQRHSKWKQVNEVLE